jgi:hypothetical protein
MKNEREDREALRNRLPVARRNVPGSTGAELGSWKNRDSVGIPETTSITSGTGFVATSIASNGEPTASDTTVWNWIVEVGDVGVAFGLELGKMSEKRRGRPPLPLQNRRKVFSIRLTPEEEATILRAAEAMGIDASSWCRINLLERARADLDSADHFEKVYFRARAWLWFWNGAGRPQTWRGAHYRFEPGDGLVAEDL